MHHEGDVAPINEVEEDEKANVTDGESVVGSDNEEDESEGGNKDKEVTIDDIQSKGEEASDEELTEIGSTCSGLTDMSGFSDLEMDFPDQEGTVDAGVDEDEKKPLNLLGKKVKLAFILLKHAKVVVCRQQTVVNDLVVNVLERN
uniref:Uncharacterized protein n=1 Tax=Panagrolaimus superbus TaxID=310955 RepID=A0A914YA17_9BILA